MCLPQLDLGRTCPPDVRPGLFPDIFWIKIFLKKFVGVDLKRLLKLFASKIFGLLTFQQVNRTKIDNFLIDEFTKMTLNKCYFYLS